MGLTDGFSLKFRLDFVAGPRKLCCESASSLTFDVLLTARMGLVLVFERHVGGTHAIEGAHRVAGW